ncbi:MAG: TonB family protein [Bacteroidales bacterium]|nr:TonB family protein [Bacteroidales bacterium]
MKPTLKYIKTILVVATCLIKTSPCSAIIPPDTTILYPIQVNGKMGFINRQGVVVIEPKFDTISGFMDPITNSPFLFAEGLCCVKNIGFDGWGCIDQEGNMVIRPKYQKAIQFSEGLAAVMVDGKYGYIDKVGQYIIEPQFDEAYNFYEGFATVKLGGLYGIIDKKGQYLVRPHYASMVYLFHEGRAITKDSNEWCGLNTTGNEVYRFKCDKQYAFKEGRATVCLKGKEGYIDRFGNLIIGLQFDQAKGFNNDGIARVKVGNQWGYIDTSGRYIITPQYYSAEAFSEGLALVNGNKFIDTTGRVVIDGSFSAASSFSGGRALVIVGNTAGYIDKRGKMVIDPIYRGANDFHGGLAEVATNNDRGYIDTLGHWVWRSSDMMYKFPNDKNQRDKGNNRFWATKNGYVGYIDRKGNEVIPFKFDPGWHLFDDDGYAIAKVDGHVGFIDTNGDFLYQPVFEDAHTFSEGLAAVKVDGHWGYIDRYRNWVIYPRFDTTTYFSEGLALATMHVGDKNVVGFIDKTGIFRFFLHDGQDKGHIYTSKAFNQNRCRIEIEGKFGYFDRTGKLIIRPQFDDAGSFVDGFARVEINGKFGYIDTTGRCVITPQFYYAEDFSEGMASVMKKNGDKVGFIDTKGRMVIQPQFDKVASFSEGLANVVIDGKYGFIDKQGTFVIQPQFEVVWPFRNGLAFVITNKEYGYINTKGEWIWKKLQETTSSMNNDKEEYVDNGDTTVHTPIDNGPEFPGGMESLYKYLAENLKYPDLARNGNIEGQVFVRFVVEKDGSISNVRVMRDIGGGCGAEAIRVIKSMPKWRPGTIKGNPVREEFNLPISFNLREE